MRTIHQGDSGEPRMDVITSLARLDLNLVLALDALLAERNVTYAARRLRLSQPALSAALSRLRTHFKDELLVRRGRAHELTPLATRLQPLAESTVHRLHTVFSMSGEFDPTTETREFVIHSSDYVLSTVGPEIRRLVGEHAPGLRLRFVFHSTGPSSTRAVLDNTDFTIMPHGMLSDVPHFDLIEDRWVCVASADNPHIGEELTLENMAELPWASSFRWDADVTPPGRQLKLLGVQPRIDTVVDGFVALPYYVAGTERLAFVQERVARTIPQSLGVRWMRPPFEAVPYVGAVWWHPVHELDPAHYWLRNLLRSAAPRFRNSDTPF